MSGETNHDGSFLFAAIICSVILVGSAVYIFWCFSRSKSLLRQWAAIGGFHILHSRLQPFSNGAFHWIYHVRVQGQDGKERSGWVHCGSYWLGILSGKTQILWECDLDELVKGDLSPAQAKAILKRFGI